MTTPAQTTQVYQLFIKSTPERIWEAITTPEFTTRYFHGSYIESTYEAGAPLKGYSTDRSELWVEGEVVTAERPRRLQHSWRSLYNPETATERPSRVTWEIEPKEGGYCLLSITHDKLEGAPKTAASVKGWTMVLSGLKTLLETGEPLVAR